MTDKELRLRVDSVERELIGKGVGVGGAVDMSDSGKAMDSIGC